jgi:hypothetical protein
MAAVSGQQVAALRAALALHAPQAQELRTRLIQATAAAQAVLLVTLIADLQLDEVSVNRFLAEARGLADQWLSRPA